MSGETCFLPRVSSNIIMMPRQLQASNAPMTTDIRKRVCSSELVGDACDIAPVRDNFDGTTP